MENLTQPQQPPPTPLSPSNAPQTSHPATPKKHQTPSSPASPSPRAPSPAAPPPPHGPNPLPLPQPSQQPKHQHQPRPDHLVRAPNRSPAAARPRAPWRHAAEQCGGESGARTAARNGRDLLFYHTMGWREWMARESVEEAEVWWRKEAWEVEGVMEGWRRRIEEGVTHPVLATYPVEQEMWEKTAAIVRKLGERHLEQGGVVDGEWVEKVRRVERMLVLEEE
ncbi:hypothetical protein BU16DRAFT_540431 [Lophium mytilinum]|uniref:Uncharacterized protein n=1 Tax=Lophium mytilinum TaxID=390894 RepID=A0A6A6QSL3_9PEZI|nr:hypothetical protein BU16DRAFT_540431 [Lophium mytilinum]